MQMMSFFYNYYIVQSTYFIKSWKKRKVVATLSKTIKLSNVACGAYPVCLFFFKEFMLWVKQMLTQTGLLWWSAIRYLTCTTAGSYRRSGTGSRSAGRMQLTVNGPEMVLALVENSKNIDKFGSERSPSVHFFSMRIWSRSQQCSVWNADGQVSDLSKHLHNQTCVQCHLNAVNLV